jgi:hypothetical protein
LAYKSINVFYHPGKFAASKIAEEADCPGLTGLWPVFFLYFQEKSSPFLSPWR